MKLFLLSCVLVLSSGLMSEAMAEDAAGSGTVPDATAPDIAHGKQIFDTICSHCHHTDHTTSGVGAPGLLDVLDRHDEAWINQWISGPEAFSQKDEKAKALVEANPFGLIMPTLPEMQKEQNREDIIAFLKTLKSK
ncbi:MAG TPA: cytochrome c [Mariprofundaceae bacterium]|nr:cytochrome c [Mariprofundaceae bacterium]